MPAHLSLVSDDPIAAEPDTAELDTAESGMAEPIAVDAAAVSSPPGPDGSWVHAAWVPPMPKRRFGGIARILCTLGISGSDARTAGRMASGSKLADEEGAVTAEYAVVILASMCFAKELHPPRTK